MALPALLFQTHHWNPVVARRYRRLAEETQGLAACHLLLQADASDGPPLPEGTHRYDPATLPPQLGLPTLVPGRLVPGCAHFPLLDFALTRAHPHYWLVEYDVEFTGSWGELLTWGEGTEADLLGTHLAEPEDCPEWHWWSSLRTPVPDTPRWRLFLPLFRISALGIQTLLQAHRSGWSGHAEVLLPTALRRAGLRVQDLSTLAPAYRPGSIEPWGRPRSSHRWRPEVSLEECQATFQPDCLYHPVKAPWTFEDGAFWCAPEEP